MFYYFNGALHQRLGLDLPDDECLHGVGVIYSWVVCCQRGRGISYPDPIDVSIIARETENCAMTLTSVGSGYEIMFAAKHRRTPTALEVQVTLWFSAHAVCAGVGRCIENAEKKIPSALKTFNKPLGYYIILNR